MKKIDDPRHKARVKAVKTLFEMNFRQSLKPQENSLAAQIVVKQKEIDSLISKHAPAWPIEQISPIDLAALRLAIFELLYKKQKEPYKVVIDEAVEISKAYGTETSAGFINGVLGSIVKSKLNIKHQISK